MLLLSLFYILLFQSGILGLSAVEDIAYAAQFLASEEAGFINGQTIIINGGQTLPENIDAIV